MIIKNINPDKTSVSIDCAKTSIPFGGSVEIDDIFYLKPEIQNGLSKKIILLVGDVNIPEEDTDNVAESATVSYTVKWNTGVLSLQHLENDVRHNYKISSGDTMLIVPRQHTKNKDFEGAVRAGILTEIVEKTTKKSKKANKVDTSAKLKTREQAVKDELSKTKKIQKASPKKNVKVKEETTTRKRTRKTKKIEKQEDELQFEDLVGDTTIKLVIHDEDVKTVKSRNKKTIRKNRDEDSMFLDLTTKIDHDSKINPHEEIVDTDSKQDMLLEDI